MKILSVQEYLVSDRKWKREHRISHARMMLRISQVPKEKQFWREVLEANVGD